MSLRASWRTGIAVASVAACALAFIAQYVELCCGWEDPLCAIEDPLFVIFVGAPLSLVCVAPRLCTRGADEARRREVRVAWWRRMPWIFMPLLIAVALLWSFWEIPWRPPNQSPDEFQSTTRSLVNFHFCAYFVGVALSGVAFRRLWKRAPSLASNDRLLGFAMATLASTALGGLVLMAILGCAIT